MCTGVEPYRWDFFIAHAGADKAVAEYLYAFLAPESRVFLDSVCLEPGDFWDVEVPAAQKASFITVVLVSSNTGKAYYEHEEILAAIALAREEKERHRVVPLFLDTGPAVSGAIPYGLRRIHSLRIGKDLTLFDSAQHLLAILRRRRANAGISAAPPNPVSPPDMSDSGAAGILHQPPLDWVSPVRRNRLPFKVAAFDLDGTLLRGQDFDFSWEAVWQGLGFSEHIQNELRREYRKRASDDPSRANRIRAYQNWCDKACDAFKQRALNRDQLRDLCQPLTLTRNCREAMARLREQAVVIAIISGGINTFLEDKFPDFRDYVDFVFINRLVFSASGVLEGVRATAFDFQGKAEALDIVCARVGCSPAEAVFVGDQFNDEAIMVKVSRAIAYPAHDTVAREVAHVAIAEDDLLAVLPYVLGE